MEPGEPGKAHDTQHRLHHHSHPKNLSREDMTSEEAQCRRPGQSPLLSPPSLRKPHLLSGAVFLFVPPRSRRQHELPLHRPRVLHSAPATFLCQTPKMILLFVSLSVLHVVQCVLSCPFHPQPSYYLLKR